MIYNFKSFLDKHHRKKLLSNFFSLSVLQAMNYILPLLTLPYLVQVLGIETYGLIVFAQSFNIFFIIFIDFGFNLSATREVSIHRNNKNKLTEIFSAVMQIKMIFSFVSFLILVFMIIVFNKFNTERLLYLLTFMAIFAQALFPFWYFQGIEKMKYITIINLLSRTIFTLSIFVFVNDKSDYLMVPLLNGVGFIIGSVISLIILYKQFDQLFILQTYNVLKKYFKDSSQFFLSRVSVSIYTSANIFILGIFSSSMMVGYYAIADKLYQALQSFYGPVTQTLYPYISKEKNLKFFKRVFYFMLVINILGVVFLYFFGPYIFDLLFAKNVGVESIRVFNILLLAILVVVPSILIGYPFLGALGFSHYANQSVILGSMIHLLGIFFLIIINHLTIYNVAIMVVITQVFDLIYRIRAVKKNRLWYSFS